jgi:hypothetical protein
MKPKRPRALSSEAFDRAFDAGEDIAGHLDVAKSQRQGLQSQRLSVDAPAWMVDRLDREAERLGITRQSLIKVWLAERLEQRT